MTQNVLNDTGAIDYVTGSLQGFGNNGTTASGGNVDNGSNTDLAYMTNPSQSQVLSALTTASDHLPNVADYTFVVPEPTGLALVVVGAGVLLLSRPRSSAKSA